MAQNVVHATTDAFEIKLGAHAVMCNHYRVYCGHPLVLLIIRSLILKTQVRKLRGNNHRFLRKVIEQFVKT